MAFALVWEAAFHVLQDAWPELLFRRLRRRILGKCMWRRMLSLVMQLSSRWLGFIMISLVLAYRVHMDIFYVFADPLTYYCLLKYHWTLLSGQPVGGLLLSPLLAMVFLVFPIQIQVQVLLTNALLWKKQRCPLLRLW